MLTRELLHTGAYLDSFQDLPEQPRWPAWRIAASMHKALTQRDPAKPVWLFAYGSLMWNPCVRYEEKQRAVLQGWHRSFCIRLLDGRASPELPGRMLALQAGGETAGLVLRIGEDSINDELGLVWVREMVHGLYCPIWAKAYLADGRTVSTLTFVVDTSHQAYEAETSIADTSKIIARASGHLGSNRDYLLQLERALDNHDLHDGYVITLAAAVRAQPSGT